MNKSLPPQVLYLDDSVSDIKYFHEKLRNYSILEPEHKISVISTRDIFSAIENINKINIDVLLVDIQLSSEADIDTSISMLSYLRGESDKLKLFAYTRHLPNSSTVKRFKDIGVTIISKTESVDNVIGIIYSELGIKSLKYENKQAEVFYQNDISGIQTPKLITDIKAVNETYLNLIKKNPNSMYNLSPRQFEEYTAELFQKMGYTVTITPQTRDGGKDLLILTHNALGDFLIYTECKRYSPDNPVGVRLIRELLGTVTADRATAGILVTSSYFTPEAKALSEIVKHQISLVDFNKLKDWTSKL